jgi:hypothetical protein
MNSFRPDRIIKKLYNIAKACKRYYSPITLKYYIFLISYLQFYVKRRFNDTQGFKKGLDSSLRSNEKSNKYINFQMMQNNMTAPILCLDFDGVIHSFKSGWKGATNIPDPPVEGAIDWLRSLLGRPINEDTGLRYIDFRVAIYSVRSRHLFGRRAMKKWLMKYNLKKSEINLIDFPLMKPQLYLQIDDRAITFTGTFPKVEELKKFQPWHKNVV